MVNSGQAEWIGRGGPIPWPPKSPDLNPLDFCVWGYAKGLVYNTAHCHTSRIAVSDCTLLPANEE